MMARIITGLILASGAVSLVLFGPQWALTAALGVVMAAASYELITMMGTQHKLDALLVAAWVLCVTLSQPFASAALPWVVMAGLLMTGLYVLWRLEPIESVGLRLMGMWGAALYLGAAGWFAAELATDRASLMAAFLVVWAGDTGAYFTGRAFGRHKLYPAVSPNKTIEGSLGGVVAGVAGALAIWWLMMPERAMLDIVWVAALGNVIAQAGDLVESALKRAADVKDSGSLLPGHGGVFDRMDSFIFVAPFFALTLV